MPQTLSPLTANTINTNKPDHSHDEDDPHVPDSLPPWIHVNNDPSDEKAPFLAPEPVVPNTRHYRPPPNKYQPGRKWDHLRTGEPGLLSAPIADEQTRWIPFMQSGPNPREYRGQGRVMDAEWMEENMPVFARKYEEEDDVNPEAAGKGPGGFKGIMYRGKWLLSPERQERTVRLFWVRGYTMLCFWMGRLTGLQRLLLKNAFVPLIFRVTVLAFSAAALAVSGSILHKVDNVNRDNDPDNQCAPRASTYMGIIVSTIAIPYVTYVTWDEYMSKPYVQYPPPF